MERSSSKLVNRRYTCTRAVSRYRIIDDYTRDGADGTAVGAMPTVVAETDGLVATFFPATGGKMASLEVKLPNGTRRELLFRNPV